MTVRAIQPFLRALLLLTPLLSARGHGDRRSNLKASWDTYSDTWVGVDGLGRVLPDIAQVGPTRRGKTLGMFYFLTLEHGLSGPFDNTKILKEHPEALNDIHNPAWGPLNSSHHWGEPLFDYYASDDAWVLRKHAQMLANAGVDVVIFDNSNVVTYDKVRNTLCEVWEDIRRKGGKTPQFACLCPFGNPDGIGSQTLRHLYETVYEPGLYSDLWFRWNGKPLVMADQSYADLSGSSSAVHQPTELTTGDTLGQIFSVDRSITAVGGEFPTWATEGSGMTMCLYKDGPNGTRLSQQHFQSVRDNSTLLLKAGQTLPPGKYYLEISRAVGKIGWWGYSSLKQSGAYEAGKPISGDRVVHVVYEGETDSKTLPSPSKNFTAQDLARAKTIHDFFTYRTPIAPYDVTNPAPGGWTWLQNYPQAVQTSPTGVKEQISVGVAQNYNSTTHLAPMSFPGAYGRSYHDGKTDTGTDAVRHGYNISEQWRRAFEVDPPFIFVTGWNEWTAGFYDKWAGYEAPPAIFVDEFNEENSRDIEPMKGGHGDDYYYQLVAKVRQYKGVRPLPPISPRPITIDGKFEDWTEVAPEYRDAIGDTAHRNAPGFGKAGPYRNDSGRNDIVAAKVSFDTNYVYFYVRTRDDLTPATDPDWMLLYINSDSDYKTGWLGYDFVINRQVGSTTTSLERNIGGRYEWRKTADIKFAARGNQMEIAVPLAALGTPRFPARIDFKWADHCFKTGDWTDFTLNGDAAPDDRFNYRAKLLR